MNENNGDSGGSFEWKLRPHEGKKSLVMRTLLDDWNRAALLGLEVDELFVDGKRVGDLQLEKLNMWLACGAAWHYRDKPHWQARDVLLDVIFGQGEGPPRARVPKRIVEQDTVATCKVNAAKLAKLVKSAKKRKNPRGPVTREQALQWMRDIDARRDSRG
jgi:hypothetical protein